MVSGIRAKPPLIIALALISMTGFAALALEKFDITDVLGEYTTSILFILLGSGLILEGNIRALISRQRDIFKTPVTTAHIVTAIVGIFVLVSGILSLPAIGIVGQQFSTIQGVAASIAGVFILIELLI